MLRHSSWLFLSAPIRRKNPLILQPLLSSATTIQSNIRKGLPMADDYKFQVLRLGYDEEAVQKYIEQTSKNAVENNLRVFTADNFISYHDSISPRHPIFSLVKNSHSTGTGRLSSCSAICRLPFDEKMVRPGGSTSGPMMMTIADAAMFAVSYAIVGKPLAVTTNFNINFFRKPMAGQELIAEARLIKGGKRLHVFEVDILAVDHEVMNSTTNNNDQSKTGETDTSDCDDDGVLLVAHASGSYSIPS